MTLEETDVLKRVPLRFYVKKKGGQVTTIAKIRKPMNRYIVDQVRSKPVLSTKQTVVLCEEMVIPNRTAKILSLSVCLAVPELSWSQQSLIDEIRVTAPALSGPGGFIDPDLTYDPVEIDAFGASTLEELLQELEPGVTERARSACRQADRTCQWPSHCKLPRDSKLPA